MKYVPRLHVSEPPRLWTPVVVMVLLFLTVLALDHMVNLTTIDAWLLGMNLLGQGYLMWYLMHNHVALPNLSVPATPYDHWSNLHTQRRQIATAYEQQIALASAQGHVRHVGALRQQMLAELREFDERCAALLEEFHASVVGPATAQTAQQRLALGPDGTLPVAPQLVRLANLPVHSPLTLGERLPLHVLAHRIASDPRQGERLREYAAAASSESPATTRLSLAMRWFIEAICTNGGVERCSHCCALKGDADCPRCEAAWSVAQNV